MIIVTGTIAFDHILDFKGRFADYILPDKIHKINISFITDEVKREFGGTAGNQAYTLALLGERPVLATTVGNDFGREAGYQGYLRKVGVITDFVEEVAKPCAVGFAMTDRDDNQIWGFGNGAAREIVNYGLEHFLKKLRKAKLFLNSKLSFRKQLFVVIAPRHEDSMVEWASECREKGIPYLFDPAFQIPKMEREELKKAVMGADIVMGNDYEIAMIERKIGEIGEIYNQGNQGNRGNQRKIVITTFGNQGSVVKDLVKGREIRVKATKPRELVDPTGAGDAYRAGFIAGYLRRLPLKVCGQMGSVAASFAIEKYGTINHRFTIEEFKARYKKIYNEELHLQKKH